MGTDRNKLFQRVIRPRISGISDDGLCRNLCGTGSWNPVIGEPSFIVMGCGSIYRCPLFQPYENRKPVKTDF